jgi:hypothetical protein
MKAFPFSSAAAVALTGAVGVASAADLARRPSPEYMTPSGGTIAWKTDISRPRPNGIAAIKCRPIIEKNVEVAQNDNGEWKYNIVDPEDLLFATNSLLG